MNRSEEAFAAASALAEDHANWLLAKIEERRTRLENPAMSEAHIRAEQGAIKALRETLKDFCERFSLDVPAN